VFIPSASAAEPRASFRPTTVSFMPAATPVRYNHSVFLAQVGPAPTRQLRAVVSLTVTISVILDERNSVLADSSCLSPHACFLGHWSFVVTLINLSTSLKLIISSSALHESMVSRNLLVFESLI
jgi:hypothetical protein